MTIEKVNTFIDVSLGEAQELLFLRDREQLSRSLLFSILCYLYLIYIATKLPVGSEFVACILNDYSTVLVILK